MKKEKIFAGIVGAVMLCSAIPVIKMAAPADYSSVYAEESSEPQTTVVYSADFEDGKNDFTGRDGYGTYTVISTDAHGGTNCLECSDRTKGWHGPQLLLDDMLEPGVEYIASAWIKAEWYNDVKMSMEYTDSAGQRHFSNLKSANSQGEWAEISEVKFSVPKGVTKAYIYFECNDGAKIYLDDFQIATAPVYEIQQDIPSLKDVYSPCIITLCGKFLAGSLVKDRNQLSGTQPQVRQKHSLYSFPFSGASFLLIPSRRRQRSFP